MANLSPQGSPQSKKQPRGKILAKKKVLLCPSYDHILSRFSFKGLCSGAKDAWASREAHTERDLAPLQVGSKPAHHANLSKLKHL